LTKSIFAIYKFPQELVVWMIEGRTRL